MHWSVSVSLTEIMQRESKYTLVVFQLFDEYLYSSYFAFI